MVCRVARGAASLLLLLCHGRVLAVLFSLLIALQLVLVGFGLSSRMQHLELLRAQNQQRDIELSHAKAAEWEARSLASLAAAGAPKLAETGALQIGEQTPSLTPAANANTQAPPALAPRDIATILSQDTNALEDALLKEDELIQAAAAKDLATPEPKTKPDSKIDALVRQGVAALIEGDMRRCILSLEEAYGLNPRHPAMLYYYGMAYDKLLNPQKARQYYTTLYQMRAEAGEYFEKATHRITYGFSTPEAMRGKLAFGPHLTSETRSLEQGEHVQLVIPILLAPQEEIRPEDIYIHVQFFDLLNGRDVALSSRQPESSWLSGTPTWQGSEERLVVNYRIPPFAEQEVDIRGESHYYGFTAKLYYRGEPMDCISSPSSLILKEQSINSGLDNSHSLLPDDGLDASFDAF